MTFKGLLTFGAAELVSDPPHQLLQCNKVLGQQFCPGVTLVCMCSIVDRTVVVM